MDKVKKLIETKPKWDGLRPYITLVDENRETDPRSALDGAKSLLETVAKTILADRGIGFSTDDSLGKLVKITIRSLPSTTFLESHDADTLLRLVGSMESIATSIGTLRNRHGAIGHGQDLHNGRNLDHRLALLGIDSTDTLSAYLIEAHGIEPGTTRLHYDDFAAFNEWFDSQNELVVGETQISISASQALFSQDIEAYKEEQSDYELKLDKETLIAQLEQSWSFASTHSVIAKLSKHEDFSADDIQRIVIAGVTNSQIAWISSDADVLEFYRRFSGEHLAALTPDMQQQYLELFPDPAEVDF